MKKFTDKLFGGLKMSWLNVILFAVATAVYTAAMMIFVRPIDLSFRDIGATFECWILFAIIIMTNWYAYGSETSTQGTTPSRADIDICILIICF